MELLRQIREGGVHCCVAPLDQRFIACKSQGRMAASRIFRRASRSRAIYATGQAAPFASSGRTSAARRDPKFKPTRRRVTPREDRRNAPLPLSRDGERQAGRRRASRSRAPERRGFGPPGHFVLQKQFLDKFCFSDYSHQAPRFDPSSRRGAVQLSASERRRNATGLRGFDGYRFGKLNSPSAS